jgi:hypothetical protein
MAWLRFFCSTSSLLVLMQIPMVAAVQCDSRRRAMEEVGRGINGGALGPARREGLVLSSGIGSGVRLSRVVRMAA